MKTACALLKKQYGAKLRDRKDREKVKAALQRRGFPYEVIRQAVDRVMQELPEAEPEPEEEQNPQEMQEALLALIRKKYMKNMTDRKGMEKTAAALYRRGYPLEEIRPAMQRILEEQEEMGGDN